MTSEWLKRISNLVYIIYRDMRRNLPFRLMSLQVPGRLIQEQITTPCDGGAYRDGVAVLEGVQAPGDPGSW
jgi:hypothetical protein